MEKRMRVGVIGLGNVGACHVDALRRIAFVDLVSVADTNPLVAQKKSEEYGIGKWYESVDALIDDPQIDAIHNCTPNNLHNEINRKIILAGKHVFSEKPLSLSSQESEEIVRLLKSHPDVVAGLNFCYRMYPLIQEMKARIHQGEIGKIYLVRGSYLQDWMLKETDYNWRIEPEYAGISRCVGDIGSHWIDLAQTVTCSRIVEVCSDTGIALSSRLKPTASGYERRTIATEDYAGVLVKFDNGSSGLFQCSQVSAGRKCFIDLEVDGAESSFHWNHETGDRMWKGNRDAQNVEILRNPNLMPSEAKVMDQFSVGRVMGWSDAFKCNIETFYRFILEGKKLGTDAPPFATFEEGHYLMRVIEAIMESGKEKRWVRV